MSLCLCCHRDVCSGPLQAVHRLVRLSRRVSGDFSNKAPLQLSVPGNCLKSASVVCALFCCGVFLRRPATRCYVTSPSTRIRPRPRPLLLPVSQLWVCPCYVILEAQLPGNVPTASASIPHKVPIVFCIFTYCCSYVHCL